ncbi:MAG: CDP-alcohol phosphatidyltransferase family protein [Phycisphaerae bacterium]|nr:CDP-alcohol phosphatidyltransferase family protein [Phycisphaerae bacterium]
MIGRAIGRSIATARDHLAVVLLRAGVRPNTLTVGSLVLTTAAAVCYALGASRRFGWSFRPADPANAYLLLAGVLSILSAACDMLDGAVARLGGQSTELGAFLDSTLDRYGDFVVYAAVAVHYAAATPANVTFVLLCALAVFHAFMISYTRARSEGLARPCSVGYWQRGERSAAILIATFAYNVPALVVQQAILPAFTMIRRIFHTKAVLAGATPITDPRQGNIYLKLRLWRWPRASIPYDLVTGLNIAWLIFARVHPADPLGQCLRAVIGSH